MASWDSAPPTSQELASIKQTEPVAGAGGWDSTPPTENELSQFESPTQLSSPSPAVSATRELVHSATAGLSDEAAGVTEAIGRALGIEGLGGPVKDIRLAKGGPTVDLDVLKGAYETAKNRENAALKEDEAQNPKSAEFGKLAGALVSPINKIAPEASLATKGAIYGGASGFGNSESDSLSGLVKDTATGTVLGYGLGAAANVATPVVSKAANVVGKKLGNTAAKFAAKALGAERGTVKKMGVKKATEIGRHALDNDVLSSFASADDLQAANDAIKTAAAHKMNQVYNAIDDAGASTFNPQDVANEVEKKLGGFYRSPINKGETRQLENTLESIRIRGDQNIPLSKAQELKEEVGKVANWGKKIDITDKERMAREAYGIVSNAIDKAAEKGAKAIGQEGLEDTLQEGKSLYALSKGADKFLENKAAREAGNQFFGLKDTIGGTTGAAIGAAGGPVGAAAGAFAGATASKAVGKYGAQNAALALDKVSKMLLKTPELASMAETNPGAFNAIVQSVAPHFESATNQPISIPAASNPKKGPARWANDGFQKLNTHAQKSGDKSLNGMKGALLSDPKAKQLLISASDLRPGSKAMDKILTRVKNRLNKEQK